MELERPRLAAATQRATGGARMARFPPVRGSIKRKIFALSLHGVALLFRDHPVLMNAPVWFASIGILKKCNRVECSGVSQGCCTEALSSADWRK
ncbi:hypothetical protein ACJRO7_024666 [Eucalyptus globulus]|uniref:Uncharacterized protein n=1 Tax=Eucalyptus globulus TaxID=34317 RepID=A0ABD3KF34_EUCGL